MQIAKFQTLPNPKQDGRAYISDHDTSHVLGKLIIVVSVNLSHVTGSVNFDEIVSQVSNLFYDSKNSNPEAALESLLGDLNLKTKSMFPGLNLNELNKSLGFFVGTQKGDTLYFTATGSVKIFLKHSLSIINILADQEDDTDSEELFSYITNGHLAEEDALVITTSPLLDYFSENKLKQVLSDNDAQGSCTEFTSLIADFSQQTYFQAVVIKNTHINRVFETHHLGHTPAAVIAHSSVTDFNSVQDKTGDLLTNNLSANLKKALLTLFQQIKGVFNKPDSLSNDHSSTTNLAIKRRMRQRNIFLKIGHKLLQILQSLFLIIVWVFKQLANLFFYLFQNRNTITSTVKQKTSKIPGEFSNKVLSLRNRYKRLSKKRQQILLVGAGLIIIFVVSIASGITGQSSNISKEEATAIFDELEVKRTSAEAALIYGNEKQAATAIAEARRLLENLEVKDKDMKARKSEIANDLFETYTTIQKIETISDPGIIIDFSTDNSGTPFQMLEFSGSGPNFWGYGDDNNIYQFEINNGAVNSIANIDSPISSISELNDNEILIYTQEPENRLFTFNSQEKIITSTDLPFNNPLTVKADFESYFSRLYVLDPRERQVFKHQQVSGSFGRGQSWITDNTIDVSEATDMAIDGNVWIVTQAGDLYRISGGEKADFDAEILDPILNSPNFIWTSIDTNKLYILDPPTRRVIILNKDGSIHKQFVSDKFDDLKSASVDEGNGKIYILNANQVFELDI